VTGDREMESGTVAVRTLAGEDLGVMTLAEFAERVPTSPAVLAVKLED